MTQPRVGTIYRVKKQYEKFGPPFIRVVLVHPRAHRLGVVDYMENGELAGPVMNQWRGPRIFQDGKGWPKLTKHWRQLR